MATTTEVDQLCICGCSTEYHRALRDNVVGACRTCKCSSFEWDGREPLRPHWGRSLFYAYCPLIKWTGGEGTCHWCDAKLTGRRRSWCSDECLDHFLGNHFWKMARTRRTREDNFTCQMCGVVAWDELPWMRSSTNIDVPAPRAADWVVAFNDVGPRPDMWNWGDGELWDLKVARLQQKLPQSIKDLVRIEDELAAKYHRAHLRRRRTPRIEVNHVVPRQGLGYGNGCHHHQTLLETLCRPCHGVVTKRQRAMTGTRCAQCGQGLQQRYEWRPDLAPTELRHRCYVCGWDSGWTDYAEAVIGSREERGATLF